MNYRIHDSTEVITKEFKLLLSVLGWTCTSDPFLTICSLSSLDWKYGAIRQKISDNSSRWIEKIALKIKSSWVEHLHRTVDFFAFKLRFNLFSWTSFCSEIKPRHQFGNYVQFSERCFDFSLTRRIFIVG